MSNNTTKAQCKHCFHFFSQSSNSTLKHHISHPHCEALKTVPEAGQSSMSRDGSVFVFNPDYLPKQVIINGFLNLNAHVNITTDVWSAPHGLLGSYLCVTAYWIEPSTLQMMKRVIAFEDFSVPHTGSALARMLRNTFIIFNLENKVLLITLDNASNNTNTIGKLKLKYDPPMKGRFYHSRCVAHVINLVVQEGLAVPTINAIKESNKRMLKDVFKSGGRNYKHYIRICKEAEKPAYSPNWDVPTRWNSTYHMFQCGLKQKVTLMYFHDLLANRGFWKENESMFPVLSRMAMDLISVQATSVAFESGFSTSERVLSIRRTKLTPSSLQMCMCLKDHLDAQEHQQHTSTLENALDFEDEILDAEV
ncbi:zinc finger BED domain-containing protein RICESLEEPER 2-like protein [Tanacetum coccineum]